MTFEHWYKENPPPRLNSTEEFNSYIKQVWNGAIEASIVLLETGSYFYSEEDRDRRRGKGLDKEKTRQLYAEDELQKLLTES